MSIVFRDYQERDIQFMVQNRRVINANEPGLGKTLEALEAMRRLDSGKALVICPKMARGTWEAEAKKWYGWESLIMGGTPEQRQEIRREFRKGEHKLLITNFALIEELLQEMPSWDTIIIDEVHLGGLLNRNTKTFGLVKKLKSRNLFLLTGTPIRRGPQDLWSLLHLIDRKTFSSYWRFVHTHCHVIDNGFGKEILGRPKNVRAFNDLVYQYTVRNLKKNVLPDLPRKTRQPLALEMEGLQKAAYEEILEEMILTYGDDILLTPNRMVQDLRLRQLSVCPRLLGIDDDGVALRTLYRELIPQQFDAGRAVVIATPFRKAIPFIRSGLEKMLPEVYVEEIHGQIKEPSTDVARRFQEHKDHRKVLIYTIKSGASWNAYTASTGFMLGYEWDANDNIQAEDRLHRIGQVHSVNWYYLLHRNTVEESVIQTLNEKTDAAQWSLHAEEMYERLEERRFRKDRKDQAEKENRS